MTYPGTGTPSTTRNREHLSITTLTGIIIGSNQVYLVVFYCKLWLDKWARKLLTLT